MHRKRGWWLARYAQLIITVHEDRVEVLVDIES